MSTGEIERRVPVDDDWRERIERKLDALVIALMGSLENPGGLVRRVENLEQRQARLEAAPVWIKQTAAGVVASVLTAIATTWAVAQALGGKH